MNGFMIAACCTGAVAVVFGIIVIVLAARGEYKNLGKKKGGRGRSTSTRRR